MTLKLRHVFLSVALAVAFVLAWQVSAHVTQDVGTPLTGQVNYTFFATSTTDVALATTTSATSTDVTDWFDSNGRLDTGALNIAGASKVTFYFGRPVHGSGGSLFKVETSPDGSTWSSFNKLLGPDVASTGTSTYTLSATGTAVVSMDLSDDTFYAVRCVVVETTDGTHTCKATVEY